MPEISRFFGIIIAMYYNDHPPPHFHVRYGEQKAIIAIPSLPSSKTMLKDVTEVRPLDGYRLHIHFEDGVEGVIDLAEIIQFTGVFAPLKDRACFVQVHVNPDVGTICWPNGADIDPDVLYALVSGEPLPAFDPTAVPVAR
jgi:hypothetical protein